MSKIPGIKRPVDIDQNSSVGRAFRNVYDNLYHLRDKVNTPPPAPESQTAPTANSGTYLPVLFKEVNLDAAVAYPAQWSQTGKVVTVSGRVDVDPTAAAQTQMGMTIPVKSNIQQAYQLGGTAVATEVASECAAIQGDTGNNRATFKWITVSAANHAMFFTFTYLVN